MCGDRRFCEPSWRRLQTAWLADHAWACSRGPWTSSRPPRAPRCAPRPLRPRPCVLRCRARRSAHAWHRCPPPADARVATSIDRGLCAQDAWQDRGAEAGRVAGGLRGASDRLRRRASAAAAAGCSHGRRWGAGGRRELHRQGDQRGGPWPARHARLGRNSLAGLVGALRDDSEAWLRLAAMPFIVFVLWVGRGMLRDFLNFVLELVQVILAGTTGGK